MIMFPRPQLGDTPSSLRQTFCHEAFFDPVNISEAVGADAEIGILRPETFETDYGNEVDIRRIDWQNSQVNMELLVVRRSHRPPD